MTKSRDEETTQVANDEMMRRKIIHVLTVYPVISSTMLQMGLGPHTKPDIWRPQLQKLLDDGTVVAETKSLLTPLGRHQSYTRLQLLVQSSDSGS